MKQNTESSGMALTRALAGGAIAGLAGGAAEVAYMGVYSYAEGISPSAILKLITSTFFAPGFALGQWGPFAGLLIHFGLSLAIGVLFGLFVHLALPRLTFPKLLALGVVCLGAIWAMNFYVILPVYNAAFVKLIRPEAALLSKLSFGVVLAFVMRLACPAVEGSAEVCGLGADKAYGARVEDGAL